MCPRADLSCNVIYCEVCLLVIRPFPHFFHVCWLEFFCKEELPGSVLCLSIYVFISITVDSWTLTLFHRLGPNSCNPWVGSSCLLALTLGAFAWGWEWPGSCAATVFSAPPSRPQAGQVSGPTHLISGSWVVSLTSPTAGHLAGISPWGGGA